MAPNHRRGPEDVIANLATKLAALQGALALGPVIKSYLSTSLPANAPTGLEIYISDLGVRAWWNGSTWVYPPQRLDRKVLTATTASITLNVPAGGLFTNLRVRWTGRSTTAGTADYMCARLNGDAGATSYVWQINQSNVATDTSAGSGGATDRIRVGTLNGSAGTSGYIGSGEFVIPDAAGSNFKAPAGYSNSANSPTNAYSGTYGGLWLAVPSVPVTSITLFPNAVSASLTAGSTATLYGE